MLRAETRQRHRLALFSVVVMQIAAIGQVL